MGEVPLNNENNRIPQDEEEWVVLTDYNKALAVLDDEMEVSQLENAATPNGKNLGRLVALFASLGSGGRLTGGF